MDQTLGHPISFWDTSETSTTGIKDTSDHEAIKTS